MKNDRYVLLDEIRGLMLISMIIYHTAWDMVYIFGVEWDWYKGNWAYVWQESIGWGFVLLSGFCWSFGRKKWKRGLLVFCAGAAVSLVTLIVMPKNRVVFGVLTMLGSCMLLMIPLEKILCKVKPYVGMVVFLFLFLYTRNIYHGYVGWKDFGYVRLPQEWYANLFTTFWGLKEKDFVSMDYFSMIPWMFLFISGYFLKRIFVQNGWMNALKIGKVKPLEILGRNALLVYMLHQPLVYGVLMVVYGV